MEKYIVIVNQKYLVSVEANSNGGAEHRCLDMVYGIGTAQAFSRDDLRTEFFRDNAIECETISFAELKSKSEAFKAALDYETGVRETIKRDRDEIENLRLRMAQLQNGVDALNEKLEEAITARLAII